jgi:hypothetical protein
MYDKLQQYMQLSLVLAQAAAPQYVQQIAMDMQATTGQAPQMGASPISMPESDSLGGIKPEEHAFVEKARAQAQSASQPMGV